ncbi:hypothetical protein MKK63_11115 [Methylobacterium sp. J-088]|uniref:hypothetical protein n=1 Tax=Methylobacterium sp. J-088 TaxID=2836664 RepID=UPI001FBB1628|nr:hypothetical protein [Methylobacterium sp. J-088]MCJ2063260.1 hypothetical protein [Methylobacterium sp. J-088]
MSDNEDPERSSPQLPQHPGTTPAQSFAMMLEQSCKSFEALQSLISGRTKIISTDFDVGSTVQTALAQSFLFYTSRSYRILRSVKGAFGLPRDVRKEFERVVAPVVTVRDVNEHGFDISRASGKVSKPSMHAHSEHSAALDETSMIILDEHTILMGPLNLCDVYKPVEAMRAVAGFQALFWQDRLQSELSHTRQDPPPVRTDL